jgi:hypothetical protein
MPKCDGGFQNTEAEIDKLLIQAQASGEAADEFRAEK